MTLSLFLFICLSLGATSATTTAEQNNRGFSPRIDTKICPQPSRCTIPTIDHTNHQLFIKHHRVISPVILRGALLDWPSFSNKHPEQFTWDYLHDTWSPENLTTGDSIHVTSHIGLGESFQMKLSDHLDDIQAMRQKEPKEPKQHPMITPSRYQTKPRADGDTPTNEPMHVFHRGMWRNEHRAHSYNVQTKANDTVRTVLQRTCTPVNRYVSESSEAIEYILGIGGAHSGTTFHRHGETWLHMIEGRKRFIIYPPSTLPPLQTSSEVSQSDWIQQVYALNSPKVHSVRAEECEVKRGDVLYIPRGWWHATVNCGETVALALQSLPSLDPLGISETQIEHVWRKNNGKLPTQLLDALYKRSRQIAPYSTTLNVLWAESNLKFNTMKRINKAVKMIKKAVSFTPHTANVHLGMAHALSVRCVYRISTYNITSTNFQKIVTDMSELVHAMNTALKLDRLVPNTGGTFVPSTVFKIFDKMEDILPKLGDSFLLDLGLDIVEEQARKTLQQALLFKLQRTIDAQACLWTETFKWYFPESATGQPRKWQYFKDHHVDIKKKIVGTKETLSFEDELLPARYWAQAETPVEKFARELHDMGGSDLSVQGPPEGCQVYGAREKMVVKDLLNQQSLLEDGKAEMDSDDEQ